VHAAVRIVRREHGVAALAEERAQVVRQPYHWSITLLADWQLTIFVVFVIAMAFCALVFGRMVWRFLRGDIEPEAGGSFGWQFLRREDRAKKPEDWLKH
jgi:hypothetical protein